MKSHTFHPEASAELEESARYYEDRQEGLGWHFRRSVRTTVDALCQNSDIFRFVGHDQILRQARVKRFPYAVMFLDYTDRVEIIAIRHFKRKPGFWLSRSFQRRII
jgi:toxin ParE1/3/4